ncbi:MAG: DEAD/DEAH box helicase [Bacteroidales bacterium]|nr:DEAD/DEAH box helicase [Bacteroidales bacterium]
MPFSSLAEPIQRALLSEGYTQPTPIQEQAIPILLNHKDLLGCAQTGTGKTAAFALPIIQSLCEHPADPNRSRQTKALILCPTRELAAQLGASFNSYARYTPIRTGVIFGGVPQNAQETILRKGVDVLIATPGRLLDLIGQGYIYFGNLDWFVLDEADLMLDMGFIPDIKRIITHLPADRQSVFLSATMPPEAVKLANRILRNPEKVDVTEQTASADSINQLLYQVNKQDKSALLVSLLRKSKADNALVFTNTKSNADRISRSLNQAGIRAESIHGNKPQYARIKALGDFKNGRTRVLVATDIAARGIDVSELSLVVNFDLPNVPQMYIHRIGRTGRAGAGGKAVSFCDPSERHFLKDIQALLAQDIPIVAEHPYNGIRKKTKSTPKTTSPAAPAAQVASAVPAARLKLTLRINIAAPAEQIG